MRARARQLSLLLAFVVAFVAGCVAGCGRDLEEMDLQARLEPFAASARFADGRAMRSPPPGAVPARRRGISAAAETGRARGQYLQQLPLDADSRVLERGRERYEIFCAPCHGLDADGRGPVARYMEACRPPSLLEGPARLLPPGRLFEVIAHGAGLMPPLGAELPPEDRWAVIAHVLERQRLEAVSRWAPQ